MIRHASDYVSSSFRAWQYNWTSFWFAARTASDIAWVRVAACLWSIFYIASWFGSLSDLIQSEGLLNPEVTRYLIGDQIDGTGSLGRLSLLYFVDRPWLVNAYLIVSLIVAAIHLVGLGGRLAAALFWLLTIGIVHRVPMMQGPGELLVTGLLIYLVIDSGKLRFPLRMGWADKEVRTTSNFALRCVQVHFLIWCTVALLSSLAEQIWWNGDAVWWLAASSKSPIWSMRDLSESPYFVNFISHSYLLVHGMMIISLLIRGSRAWGIAFGFAMAIFTFAIAGDWLYGLGLIVGLSSFAGNAAREVVSLNADNEEVEEATISQEARRAEVPRKPETRSSRTRSKSR